MLLILMKTSQILSNIKLKYWFYIIVFDVVKDKRWNQSLVWLNKSYESEIRYGSYGSRINNVPFAIIKAQLKLVGPIGAGLSLTGPIGAGLSLTGPIGAGLGRQAQTFEGRWCKKYRERNQRVDHKTWTVVYNAAEYF